MLSSERTKRNGWGTGCGSKRSNGWLPRCWSRLILAAGLVILGPTVAAAPAQQPHSASSADGSSSGNPVQDMVERFRSSYKPNEIAVVRLRVIELLIHQLFDDEEEQIVEALRSLVREKLIRPGSEGQAMMHRRGALVYVVLAPVVSFAEIPDRVDFGYVEQLDEAERQVTIVVTRLLGERTRRFSTGFGSSDDLGPSVPTDPLERAIYYLSSEHGTELRKGLQLLATLKVDEKDREKIEDALLAALDRASASEQTLVLEALKRWGSERCVPRVAPLLTSLFTQEKAAELLVHLNSEASARAFAQLLLSRSSAERELGARGLIRLGTTAEPVVLEYLKGGTPQVQYICCLVLQQIGTERSVPTLRLLIRRRPQRAVREAARSALATINARVRRKNEELSKEGNDSAQARRGATGDQPNEGAAGDPPREEKR